MYSSQLFFREISQAVGVQVKNFVEQTTAVLQPFGSAPTVLGEMTWIESGMNRGGG